MKKLLLLWVISLFSVSGWASDGDVFTAKTIEGFEMTFRVISESEKTCQVGDGTSSSVSNRQASGVTIPNEIKGYTIVAIGNYAFYQCGGIKSFSVLHRNAVMPASCRASRRSLK